MKLKNGISITYVEIICLVIVKDIIVNMNIDHSMINDLDDDLDKVIQIKMLIFSKFIFFIDYVV